MLALLLAIAGIGSIAAPLVLPGLIDTPAFRARLADASESELGAPLRYRRLEVRLVPPALVLVDAELVAPGGVDLEAERAELFLDLAALARGERDGDAVRAVEVSAGRLRIPGVHARPGAILELGGIAGRAEAGRGIDARAVLSPRGSIVLRTKTGDAPFEATLVATIHDAAASALAPWLAALRIGGAGAGGVRIDAGRLDGTVELSGAIVPTERAYAELSLSALAASFGDATLRGDVQLTVDLRGLHATPSGVFALDARDAELAGGPLRKAAGQAFTLSGALAPRSDGASGFVVERARAAPLDLDLDVGDDVPVWLRIGKDAVVPHASNEERAAGATDAAP